MKTPQPSLMDPTASRFWNAGYCKWLEDTIRYSLSETYPEHAQELYAEYKEETLCRST